MIIDDIRTALAVAFPVDVLVIHAHANGPRPDGLYVTMRMDGNVESMRPHVGRLVQPDPAPAMGSRTLAAHRSGSLEIQCFGEGSFDVLQDAILRINSIACVEAGEVLDIVFGASSEVQSLPVMRNESSWEPRAIATLAVAYTRGVDEELSSIETVEAVAEIDPLPPMPIYATIVDN